MYIYIYAILVKHMGHWSSLSPVFFDVPDTQQTKIVHLSPSVWLLRIFPRPSEKKLKGKTPDFSRGWSDHHVSVDPSGLNDVFVILKYVGITGRWYWHKHKHQHLSSYLATVDGSEILNKLRLVVSPIIYRVLYIHAGTGFLPSTVCIYLFI